MAQERLIEARDYYYRDRNGKLWTQRWIGNRCIESDHEAPIVLIDWWGLQAVWTTLVKLQTALVKEGPKAMVLYEHNRN